MKECIIDTDIFSYYMRNVPNVVAEARNYLNQFGYFNISSLTVFEVLKGLRKKRLNEKERIFHSEISKHNVIGLNHLVMDKAAALLVSLEKEGNPIAYGDLFIASTALTYDLVLVTNNTRHFSKIDELCLKNWAG